MNDTQLGRYHITRVLGQGSMGIVYEARDPHLDRSVAVKTARTRDLPADQAAAYERRFLTEARSAARLRHPSIVSVFDAGKDGAVTYLVMEFVDGVNLKHCLNNGVRFTPAGAVHLVLSVLAGLEHAHEQRVIHRDVKPENVLLDLSGLAKLTDFGIAKLLESDTDNGTQVAGLSIGTPRYMSPEQVKGLPVDTRTDLYSAGVLLFELLTATTPFDGTHHMAVASQILHDPAPLPSSRAPAVPPELDALVSKALAKLPEDRFQTAEAFRNALTASMGSQLHQIDVADAGAEPALVLVQPDTAPILRWLFAQARANHPATDAPAPVSVLPNGADGTHDESLATSPTLVLPTAAPPPVSLDGTRVAQREGFATGNPVAQTSAKLVPPETLEPVIEAVAEPVAKPDATVVSVPPLAGTVALPQALADVPVVPAGGGKKWLWIALGVLAVVGAVIAFNRARAPQPVPQPVEEFLEDSRGKTPVADGTATAAPAAADATAQPAAGSSAPVPGAAGDAATPAPEETAAARARREARAKAKAKADADAAAAAAAASTGSPTSAAASSSTESAPPAAPPVTPAPTKQDTQGASGKSATARPEPCVGLSFFERESCLWKQCDTDAFRRHPACKRFNPEKQEPLAR